MNLSWEPVTPAPKGSAFITPSFIQQSYSREGREVVYCMSSFGQMKSMTRCKELYGLVKICQATGRLVWLWLGLVTKMQQGQHTSQSSHVSQMFSGLRRVFMSRRALCLSMRPDEGTESELHVYKR